MSLPINRSWKQTVVDNGKLEYLNHFVPPDDVNSHARVVFCNAQHVNSDRGTSQTSDLQNSVWKQLPD